jgi:ketosteroid isomerase-like protein
MAMAADRERDVQLVRDGFEAFRRGDFEAVMTILDEDVEVFMPPDLPNSGTYRGHDGYRKWVAEWLDAWDAFTPTITSVEPVGSRHLLARVHQTARGKGSGIEVEMDVAYLFEVRDGRAAAMHLYLTPEQAVAVALERERSAE